MTESQFTLRLLLTILVGVIFIVIMTKLSIRNSDSTTKTPIGLKILGGVFITLAVLSGIGGIGGLTVVEHSSTTNEIITGIVRPSSATLYWGYPTTSQNTVLSLFMSFFVVTAYGIYFFRFKSSPVSWWKKALKVLSFIIILFLIYSSTNLHYFDWWELWPNLLLIAIIYCNFKFAGKTADNLSRSNITPAINRDSQSKVIPLEKPKDDDVIFETEDVEL